MCKTKPVNSGRCDLSGADNGFILLRNIAKGVISALKDNNRMIKETT